MDLEPGATANKLEDTTLSPLGTEPGEQSWRVLATQILDYYLALDWRAHGYLRFLMIWVGFVSHASPLFSWNGQTSKH